MTTFASGRPPGTRRSRNEERRPRKVRWSETGASAMYRPGDHGSASSILDRRSLGMRTWMSVTST